MQLNNLSNKEILHLLDKKVYGHLEAKKVLINSVTRSKLRWHQKFSLGIEDEEELVNNKNVLLIGESGSGKTYLVECLQEICDFSMLRFDATQIQPAGAGASLKLEKIIKDIQVHCAYFAERSNGQFTAKEIMHQTFIFIDEVDKLAESFDSSGNWNRQVQANLLQLISGKTEIKGCTFIFAGAFTSLTNKITTDKGIGFFGANCSEDTKHIDWDAEVVKSGLIAEFVGRIDSVVKLDNLKANDYVSILKKHIMPKILRTLRNYGIYELQLCSLEIDNIVNKCMKSGQGVRMLTKHIQKIAEEREFNYDSDYYNSLELSCDAK